MQEQQIQYREIIKEVPQTQVQEVIRHVPVVQTQEVIKEVPQIQIQTVEKIVEVPQVEIVEKIVHVPQIVTQEMIKHVHVPQVEEIIREVKVPQIQIQERHVEVPQIQTVERIVEVPQLQTREVLKHVPVVQIQEIVREVHVPQVQEVHKEVHVPQVQIQEKTVEVRQLPPTTVVAPTVRSNQVVMAEPVGASIATYSAPPAPAVQTVAMPVTTVQAPAQYMAAPATTMQFAAPPATTVVAPAVYAAAAPVMTASRVVAGVGVGAGALQIGIISAKSLRDADWLPGGGKSDPYVKVEIKGKPHATFQTPVVNNSCDPVWNCTHEIMEFAQGDVLIFTVLDSDPFKGDDILGQLELASYDFYPMGIQGEFKLDNAGKNVEAFLTLSISIMQTMGAQVPMEPVAGAPQMMTYAAPTQTIVQGQSMFDMIDRNHDGMITRSEFNAVVR